MKQLKYHLTTLLLLPGMALMAQVDSTSFTYKKTLFDFDQGKPVFKLESEQLSNKNRFLRYYALTGYREGAQPVSGFANFSNTINKEQGTSRLYFYNSSKQDILTYGFYKSNHVILEVKDPSKYRYDPSQGSREEWYRKNAYCFELMIPIGTYKSYGKGFFNNTLGDAVASAFGVKCSVEKRMVAALVLVRTSNADKVKSKGLGKRGYDMKGSFINVPIDRIQDPLNQADMPPFVDETGYKDPIDIELKITSWSDLPALRKALQQYDLDLKPEQREIEMFVIREVK